MAAQNTASTEAPTATTIRSRRNSAPYDEFGGAAFGAVVVNIRSFPLGPWWNRARNGTGWHWMALGTPRSDCAEARGQQWAAEDAGSVARHQLQMAARSPLDGAHPRGDDGQRAQALAAGGCREQAESEGEEGRGEHQGEQRVQPDLDP